MEYVALVTSRECCVVILEDSAVCSAEHGVAKDIVAREAMKLRLGTWG